MLSNGVISAFRRPSDAAAHPPAHRASAAGADSDHPPTHRVSAAGADSDGDDLFIPTEQRRKHNRVFEDAKVPLMTHNKRSSNVTSQRRPPPLVALEDVGYSCLLTHLALICMYRISLYIYIHSSLILLHVSNAPRVVLTSCQLKVTSV